MKYLLTLGVSLLTSFGVSFLMQSLLLRPARKFGFVDKPLKNNKHKLHTRPVPLIGGVSVFVAFFLGILVVPGEVQQLNVFLFCCLLIVLVGVLDDLQDISAGFRLIMQAFVGVIMVATADMSIREFGDILAVGNIYFVDWAMPVTILAVLSAINAMNMMDGIDGLAASIAVITLSALVLLAYLFAKAPLVLLLLIAALLPFMAFNLGFLGHKQKIYLGDAGSTLLGFIIVWFLVDLSQGEGRAIRPVTALWIFALPLMDMVTIAVRRIVSGRSPFIADREHLHHLLKRYGFNDHNSVFWISLASIGFAIVGIIAEWYKVNETILFISFLMVFFALFYRRQSS